MNKSVVLGENLALERCKPLHTGESPLSPEMIEGYRTLLPDWKQSGKHLVKSFKFKDFHETIGFVNALAFIANREDHHPELEVGYSTCLVRYGTHDVGGLSKNDFICAAKIDGFMNGCS
jgi:4a-hydroxytetrahydrobiopterin dehydratase